MTMLLRTAHKFATRIADELDPLCDRIQIAGSIRRLRPMCTDIDIVCLASGFQRQDIRSRCLRSAPVIRCDGDQMLKFTLSNGVAIDIYFARHEEGDLFTTTPCNWGSILVCRTGPKEFNQAFALQAAAHGLHWDPFRGLMRGQKVIASETEHGLFDALHIPYVEPSDRDKIHIPELVAA